MEDIWRKNTKLTAYARQSGKKESIIDPSSWNCIRRNPHQRALAEHGIVGNGWYDRTLNGYRCDNQIDWSKVKKSGALKEKRMILPVPIYFGGTTCIQC